ncbi:hypothetical protein JEO77_19830 [Aeromonas veronii]|uniref:hypothetical protein n=1 Tax=Aeromonas veronii TaxID=654 RepID=UPI00191DDB9F|nr:hypothetical protein [Aeromonas veronii]MBL0443638.1 hypothetical protein [Aeromonas veronii]
MKHQGWLLSLALLGWPVVAAPQITPEMMAKFKQLSPAQQQALAAQYGVNPAQLGVSAGQSSVTPVNTAPVAAPREVDYSQASQRPLQAGVA